MTWLAVNCLDNRDLIHGAQPNTYGAFMQSFEWRNFERDFPERRLRSQIDLLFDESLDVGQTVSNTDLHVPDWADERLSRDLPVLRSRGEGQELEYMEAFPTNTRELAKEIAAFASTNTGTILIGVSDSGDLIGLPSCETPEGRDETIRRLEGVSRGP